MIAPCPPFLCRSRPLAHSVEYPRGGRCNFTTYRNYTTMYKVLAFLLSSVQLTVGHAQYGNVDPAFMSNDDGLHGDGPVRQHLVGGDFTAEGWDVMEAPDGRILFRGNQRFYNGVPCNLVIRIWPDGRLENAAPVDIPSGYGVSSFCPLVSGGMLVALTAFPSSGRLVHYDASGALDPGFEVLTDRFIHEIMPLPDGRIMIAGPFTLINGLGCGPVARVLADGAVDMTFQTTMDANARVDALLQLPGGDVVIGGSFTMVNGSARHGLARLHEDGSLDPIYAPDTPGVASVAALALDVDGRLLVGGSFEGLLGSSLRNLARFDPDGLPDLGFNTGTGPDDAVFAILPLEDGRTIIGGRFTTYNGLPRPMLTRLSPNGQADSGFEHVLGGSVHRDVRSIRKCMNGEFLVAGRFNRAAGRLRNCLVRLHDDGSLVETFAPGRGPGGLLRAMAIMQNGRIAIGGDIPSFNDRPRPYLAILDQNGTLLPDAIPAGGPNGPVELLLALSTGGLFLAGEFTEYDGQPVEGMVYTDEQGQLVQVVHGSLLAPGEWVACGVQYEDDGLLLAVCRTEGQGYAARLLKLLSDGTLDETFEPPVGIAGLVGDMELLPDGRILLAGNFTTLGAFSRRGIARLMPHGAVDASFNPGLGIGYATSFDAWSVASLHDGRILIAGRFNTFNGIPVGNLACLTFDGGLDPSFSGTGTNGTITSLQVLQDDRFVLAGLFDQFGGANHPNLAVGLPNGEQDPSFHLPGAPEYVSWTRLDEVVIDPNGHYLVRGPFHRIGGVVKHRIARILGGGGLWTTGIGPLPNMAVWPNPSRGRFHLGIPIDGRIVDAQGRQVVQLTRSNVVDLDGSPPGVYLLQTTGHRPMRLIHE